MFLTPSSTPCWTIERSPKIKKRAPRCMGTLRQKTERAPRCMGTLFVFSWSSWVPPRAPQAIAPNIHFQTFFCIFCSSGSTWWPLRAWSRREGRRGAARTDGRTDVETGAGAQTAPATHPGKKYDVRRPPPHSDYPCMLFLIGLPVKNMVPQASANQKSILAEAHSDIHYK